MAIEEIVNPYREENGVEKVWANVGMDEARRTECLCLTCDYMPNCPVAAELYDVCKTYDMALMITRCGHAYSPGKTRLTGLLQRPLAQVDDQ